VGERIIRFLLSGKDPASLAGPLAALDTELPEGVSLAYGMRDIRGSPAGTAHGKALGEPPIVYDAFVEFREAGGGGFERLEAIACDAAAGIAPFADLAHSSVIEGHCHILMSRPGPFMMIFALSPPAGMSHDAFIGHWRDIHAPMVVAASRGKGSYLQLHGDPAASKRMAGRVSFGGPVFSGHAGGWLSDPAAVVHTLSLPASLAALEDERRFIDHSRSSMGIFAFNGSRE